MDFTFDSDLDFTLGFIGLQTRSPAFLKNAVAANQQLEQAAMDEAAGEKQVQQKEPL